MKPLILLHGALGAASDFQELKSHLAANYELYIPDLPGHGTKAHDEKMFSIDSFANFLSIYIESQKLVQPMIFGYSMGGYVACLLESKHPTFEKIYTFGTKFLWNPAQAAKEAGALQPEAVETKFPAYAAGLANKHGEHWRNNMLKTAQMMRSLGEKAALESSDYSKISCKVAVAVGDKDKMVSIEEATEVYRRLPEACLDVLPFTQHPLDRVNPNLLAKRLNYFFHL